MRRHSGLATVVLAGAAAAVFLATRAHAPRIQAVAPSETTATAAAVKSIGQSNIAPSQSTMHKPASAELPLSFQGAEIDGGVAIGSNGRIVPTRALRELFDYYLSGVGEYRADDPALAVKTRLRAYADAHALSDAVRRQLLALFDRYLAYRSAAADYITARSQDRPARTLQVLSEMRLAYLGTGMADAFYGEQEQLTHAAMARRAGRANAESLTGTQRRAVAPVELAEQVQSLRDNGASQATVAAAREQVVGRAAAQRLAALDARQAKWADTLAGYRRERTALMASGMAAADRQKALKALRQRHFSERDMRRVKALDRLAQSPPDVAHE